MQSSPSLWLGPSIVAPSRAMQMGCRSAPQGFNLLLQPWQLCQLCFQQLHAAVLARSTALAASSAPAPAQSLLTHHTSILQEVSGLNSQINLVLSALLHQTKSLMLFSKISVPWQL